MDLTFKMNSLLLVLVFVVTDVAFGRPASNVSCYKTLFISNYLSWGYIHIIQSDTFKLH